LRSAFEIGAAACICCGLSFSIASAADVVAVTPPDTVSAEWMKVWPSVVARSQHQHGNLPAPGDLADWAKAYDTVEKMVAADVPGIVSANEVTVEPGTLHGVPILSIAPKGWIDDGRIVIYVHGGAFTFLSARSTLFESALMANRSGMKVISVDYTPAPAARWRQITDQVVSVYQAVLESGHKPAQIGMWGDSAGGSIVAGATLKLRDKGLPVPAALVLWAPWSDVSMAGDTYTTLADADPSLNVADLKQSAAAYADAADQKNPYVSPVYGDYSKGFPPTLIQGGTREIFLSNCVRQYQAISQAGMPATLDLYEGMVHVFQPIAPDSPEGRAALMKTIGFLNEHLRTAPRRSPAPAEPPK